MDALIAHTREALADVPAGARVVVAMSGGVDSSVCAALCQAAGYDVVGITLQLYDHGAAVRRTGTCCAGADIHDARRVAGQLSIPHYVLDYESRFREAVIDDFVDSYQAGETPIPCVRCNQTVKFQDLLRTARDLGAAALATGHYVRRIVTDAGPELHRAVDPRRDQSYFLFATTPAQLGFLRFPLGAVAAKDEIRQAAAALGLGVAEKPDSQDICFVPEGRYAETILRLRPGAGEPGDIVNVHGRVLGRHEGIIHFTVGQRRGLGVSGPAPLYVLATDPARRRVVVGPREALLEQRLRLRALNWLAAPDALAQGVEAMVKVRSTQPPVPARIVGTSGGKGAGEGGGAAVTLHEPEMGVAPGQACVAYDGERLLGGGWIARRESVRIAA